MPIIEVTLIEGRSIEKKVKMIRAVTDAVVETLEAPPDSVKVIVREVPKWHFGSGGEVKGMPS